MTVDAVMIVPVVTAAAAAAAAAAMVQRLNSTIRLQLQSSALLTDLLETTVSVASSQKPTDMHIQRTVPLFCHRRLKHVR